MLIKNIPALGRVAEKDLDLCLRFNRLSRLRGLRQFFAAVSRLGNGVFWYALMLILPAVYAGAGLLISLHMLAVGAAGLGIYKVIKSQTHRPRPYLASSSIDLGTSPLDQYSFPSGHTLHAVGFSIIVCAYFPVLAWLLVPFTCLTALSRVILGLHYPSDVAMGAFIGALTAATSLQLAPVIL